MGTHAALARGEICQEGQQLAEAYREAVHEVMELQDRELAALVQNGSQLERLDLALKRARQKMTAAKKRFLLHVRAHGCEP